MSAKCSASLVTYIRLQVFLCAPFPFSIFAVSYVNDSNLKKM